MCGPGHRLTKVEEEPSQIDSDFLAVKQETYYCEKVRRFLKSLEDTILQFIMNAKLSKQRF